MVVPSFIYSLHQLSIGLLCIYKVFFVHFEKPAEIAVHENEMKTMREIEPDKRKEKILDIHCGFIRYLPGSL